jgi:large subunit ribosomal protein L23
MTTTETEVFKTLVRPLLTERSTILKEKHNQYLFEVRLNATKGQIKDAVQELFKVKVERVRTMVLPGKYRRYGAGGAYRSDWKKAIVTLAKDQKIDFTEQAG